VITHTITQTTGGDFTSGTQSGTTVTSTAGGEVQLQPSASDDFTGTALGSGWTTNSWAPSGGGPTSVTVSGGTLSVGGAEVSSAVAVPAGATIEGRVSFGATPYQHFGLATDFANVAGNYWAMFSTGGTSDSLFARVNVNGSTQDVNVGALPSGFHVYRVQPVTGAFQFYVDGVLKTTLNATVPTGTPLKIAASAFNGSSPLLIDFTRVASYPSTGTFTSAVLDAGTVANWLTATWNASLPAGTSLVVETRSGGTALPDGTWSDWSAVGAGGAVTSPAGRYLQYRLRLATSDPTQSAVFFDISISWS
jgi:hypothetical protein